MIRALAVSTGLHLGVLMVLMFLRPVRENPAPASIKLRLIHSDSTAQELSVRPGLPDEPVKEHRLLANDVFEEKDAAAHWLPSVSEVVRTPILGSRAVEPPSLPTPLSADFPLETPDPLAGFPHETKDEPPVYDDFSLSWESGDKRDILYVPKLDLNAIPSGTDRLIDMKIRIVVSPEGAILSAKIQEPGTGDIRIDRYMHTMVLSFVFEARPLEEEPQTGIFTIRFLGGEE